MGIFNTGVFVEYHVALQFRGKIMGGVPKNPEVIEGWLRSKMGLSDTDEIRLMVARTLTELGVEITPEMTVEEMIEASRRVASAKSTNGFKVNADGLYIESRQVKAMIKECVNILFAGDRWGATKKGPRSFVAERVFPVQDAIPLGRSEPDGIELVVGHVSGPQGPRSTITYHEYADQPRIEFDLLVLRDSVESDHWAEIWNLAEENGLGALRSQGYGRFDILEWKRGKDALKAVS